MNHQFCLKNFVVALLFTLLVPISTPALAQSVSAELLQDLRSDNWEVRATGVERLLSMPDELVRQPTVAREIIALQERENDLIASNFRKGTSVDEDVELAEEFSEYYSGELYELVMRVADLNDPATLRVLVGGSYNPDSKFAGILAAVGDPVVPAVAELAQSDIFPRRECAYNIMGTLLENSRTGKIRLSSENRELILERLKAGVEDPQASVRQEAVVGLGKSGDKRFLGLLEKIEAADPAVWKNEVGGKDRYPVREAAQAAIKQLNQ